MAHELLDAFRLSREQIAAKAIPLPGARSICGVYFLLKDQAVVYVGQSINIEHRISSQRASKEFDAYAYIEVPKHLLAVVERRFIADLLPPLNIAVPASLQHEDKLMRINKKAVDALKPGSSAGYYWDDELKGFGVRVNPNGKKVWLVRYRVRTTGTQRMMTIGATNVFTPEQAKDRAMKILAASRDGKDAAKEIMDLRDGPTIEALCDRFMREHVRAKRKPSTVVGYNNIIEKHIKKRWGSIKVFAFGEAEIIRFQAEYGARHQRQCNKAVAVLSKAMNLAEAWGYRPKNSNPCKGIERFKNNSREMILDSEQLVRLWRVLDEVDQERLRAWQITWLVRLLILTGARDGEIMAAKWEHVDWERKILHLPDSKGGKDQIALSDAALEVLKAIPRPRAASVWILPGRRMGRHFSSPWDAWRKITKRAGIEGFWLHDLRHNYASEAHEMGLTVKQVQGQLRHKTMVTTMRYINLLDKQKATDAQRVGQGFAKKLGLSLPAKSVENAGEIS